MRVVLALLGQGRELYKGLVNLLYRRIASRDNIFWIRELLHQADPGVYRVEMVVFFLMSFFWMLLRGSFGLAGALACR